MEAVKNFYDLKVWEDAHSLTLQIYKFASMFPQHEQFGLASQIRRSSSSIGANIAEGFGRSQPKDKARFYSQAKASASETQNHLLLARDLGYIDKQRCNNLIEICVLVEKELSGLISSMRNVYS